MANVTNGRLAGEIYRIDPSKKYKDFSNRIFWVKELDVKFPNFWELEMWHDRVSELEYFAVGDIVEIEFIIHGRVYEKDNQRKVKTTVECVSIKNLN